ncbi:aspartate aminotransferase family protein [Solitalea longa]|uniref:Aspartate aminotransferase family protein n=1 Tax=Solitalea longa TaxID=2079460 RepID=A0A2S5A346_9SPHI|nr:aspartate aminotransferase family protein [Solitalea longa]POY36944.1 aspartate aminotransferase family protein [Solitalea longa]
MNLFDVYPLFPFELVKAEGSYVWDENGNKYLDLYGGHAVISIGHTHPHYVKLINEQLNKIGFYSNSVQIPIQKELAKKLGELTGGYEDYSLFLCNSGAEANENALKLASFHTGRKKIVAFSKSFHGRTSAVVAATDDKSIIAPINETSNIIFVPFNDEAALEAVMNNEIAGVIIEGLQGVGGVQVPTDSFLQKVRSLCDKFGALMIMDEIQSGYGRSGKFFAHQHSNVKADIISMAKGMGNGFPIGGIIIAPHIEAKHGMLGTTFGGNHLACAAAIAVCDIIKQEKLMQNAAEVGSYLMAELKKFEGIKDVRGYGLMIGVELDNYAEVRKKLMNDFKILTGVSGKQNTIRLLPPLNITKAEAEKFLQAFEQVLNSVAVAK